MSFHQMDLRFNANRLLRGPFYNGKGPVFKIASRFMLYFAQTTLYFEMQKIHRQIRFSIVCGVFLAAIALQASVETAFAQTDRLWSERFTAAEVRWPSSIFLVVMKIGNEDGNISVWGYKDAHSGPVRIHQFPICYISGGFGPKRCEGDEQVPEGVYFIDRFNPQSRFHRSLGINYPNESDRILSTCKKKGGDIFIHGSCASIGCVSIGNENIEELYGLCDAMRRRGAGRIPVFVFPVPMDDTLSMRKLHAAAESNDDRELAEFWRNLSEVYSAILNSRGRCPAFRVDEKGRYRLQR
jgi:murein L,D-transpeptidase YafK